MPSTIAEITAGAASLMRSLTDFAEQPAARVGPFEIAPAGRATAQVDVDGVVGEAHVVVDSWRASRAVGETARFDVNFDGSLDVGGKTWTAQHANHIRVVVCADGSVSVESPYLTLRSAKGGSPRREVSQQGAEMIARAIERVVQPMTVNDVATVLRAARDADWAGDALRHARAAHGALNQIAD